MPFQFANKVLAVILVRIHCVLYTYYRYSNATASGGIYLLLDMKITILFAFVLLTLGCSSEENVSKKMFEEITLVNKIEFNNSKFDQPKFSCGFLLKYKADTFAITAKHLLKIIKPDDMKAVVFDNMVKAWYLYPLPV